LALVLAIVLDLNRASTELSTAQFTATIDAWRNAMLVATLAPVSTVRTSARPASVRTTIAISAMNSTTPRSRWRGQRLQKRVFVFMAGR